MYLIFVLGPLDSSLNLPFISPFHRENSYSLAEKCLWRIWQLLKADVTTVLSIVRRRKRSSLEKSDSLPQRNCYKSCEPQVPTEMHHLMRINRSQIYKILGSFRNLISSISSSNLAYSLIRGSNVTCFFHLSYRVKKLVQFRKMRGVWPLTFSCWS